jgi:hypothetical protein
MRIVSAFILFILIVGCGKEQGENTQCKELQSIFLTADETRIKQAVTESINSLPSQAHTQESYGTGICSHQSMWHYCKSPLFWLYLYTS